MSHLLDRKISCQLGHFMSDLPCQSCSHGSPENNPEELEIPNLETIMIIGFMLILGGVCSDVYLIALMATIYHNFCYRSPLGHENPSCPLPQSYPPHGLINPY